MATVFSILLLCNISNIYTMDSFFKSISDAITGPIDRHYADSLAFYYKNTPVTQESFYQLREIAFHVYFEEKSFACDIPNMPQEFTQNLFDKWANQFQQEYLLPNLENSTLLAKIVKHYIAVDDAHDEENIAIIQYNDKTDEFTGGMALLLSDIQQRDKKPYDLEKKGKKIHW